MEYIMSILNDNPAVLTAPPGPLHAAFADVVNSLGDKLGAALAHTSGATELESRRRIEEMLGRKLEPLFALQLVTLLFAQGSEARELRAAFVQLLSLTESPQWVESLTQGASAMFSSDDESRFLASEAAACVRDFARCGECLARSAVEREGESPTSGEAAGVQWVLCAQCRCGTAAWYRS
jgi:hypothetical protein